MCKYDDMAVRQRFNEFIEKEMHICKSNVLKVLAHSVHSNTEDFALMLAYCYFDCMPTGMKIADKLNLGKLEFLAVQEEFEAFREEYLDQKERYETIPS
jgi:hypothetical protein